MSDSNNNDKKDFFDVTPPAGAMFNYLMGTADELDTALIEGRILRHKEEAEKELQQVADGFNYFMEKSEEIRYRSLCARLKTAETAVQEKMLESMQSMTDKLKQYPFVHETIKSLDVGKEFKRNSLIQDLLREISTVRVLVAAEFSKMLAFFSPFNTVQYAAAAAGGDDDDKVFEGDDLKLERIDQDNGDIILLLESSKIDLSAKVTLCVGGKDYLFELEEEDGIIYGEAFIPRDDRYSDTVDFTKSQIKFE